MGSGEGLKPLVPWCLACSGHDCLSLQDWVPAVSPASWVRQLGGRQKREGRAGFRFLQRPALDELILMIAANHPRVLTASLV